MTNLTEFTFLSSDGKTRLHAMQWLPEGTPRAVLQISHGVAEHIGRYDGFARYLNEQGLAVVGHDHLGHGGSLPEGGTPVYYGDGTPWETVVADIQLLHEQLRREFSGVPLCLMGHSMGSFLARSYLYAGYLEERQRRWLEQDLASVPAGSTVVVCLHIPTWSCAARRGEWGKEQTNKVLNNRRALYKLLEPYRAHILSAHEHYNENYTPVPHVFEHVHAPLSTLFWQTPLSMDGIPAGYAVYETADGRIASWYWKAVDHDRGRQFTAYAAGAARHKPDAVTVNVWNYAPAWKVRWYEDGRCRGEMTRYTGYDESICDYVARYGDRFKYKYIGAAQTEHLFYAVPSSPDAEVRVEVTDRFGNVYEWSAGKGYTSRPAAQTAK